VPFEATGIWVLPAAFPYLEDPAYGPAIFPQARLVGVAPCGVQLQHDVYLIESEAEQLLYQGLGDTLEQGEDSAIYLSHTFERTAACVVPPVEQPVPPVDEVPAPPVVVVGVPAAPVVPVAAATPIVPEPVAVPVDDSAVLASTGVDLTGSVWLVGGLLSAGVVLSLVAARRARRV
jgi:hypothetical protein